MTMFREVRSIDFKQLMSKELLPGFEDRFEVLERLTSFQRTRLERIDGRVLSVFCSGPKRAELSAPEFKWVVSDEWTLYGKTADGVEPKLYLAHPQTQEWVGTAVFDVRLGLKSFESASGSLWILPLKEQGFSRFSNLGIRLRFS